MLNKTIFYPWINKGKNKLLIVVVRMSVCSLKQNLNQYLID